MKENSMFKGSENLSLLWSNYNSTSCLLLQQSEEHCIKHWKMDNCNLTHVSAYWTVILFNCHHSDSNQKKKITLYRECNLSSVATHDMRLGHFRLVSASVSKRVIWNIMKVYFTYSFIFMHANKLIFNSCEKICTWIFWKQKHQVNSRSDMAFSLLYQDNDPMSMHLFKINIVIFNSWDHLKFPSFVERRNELLIPSSWK